MQKISTNSSRLTTVSDSYSKPLCRDRVRLHHQGSGMIRVGVKTDQNCSHGDGVGFTNFGLPEPTNTAVNQKKKSNWKSHFE